MYQIHGHWMEIFDSRHFGNGGYSIPIGVCVFIARSPPCGSGLQWLSMELVNF